MRGTLTIAAREVRERMFVFAVAAMIAIMPFVVSALSGRDGHEFGSVLTVVGSSATALLMLGLAMMLGRAIIVRDLAERRLSFYFSKPVSSSAIWFGKLAGSLALIVLSGAIIFLPSFVFGHNQWAATWNLSLWRFITFVIAYSIGLLLVSHALATVTRSRSKIAAIDLVLLAGAGTVAWMLIRPLFFAGATKVTEWIIASLVIAVPVIIAAAGAAQLARGRTEIRRSHLEFSKFVWSATGIVLALTAGYVGWVLSASPRDMKDVEWASDPNGEWVAVTGIAQNRGDYRPLFLIDGKSVRLRSVMGSRGEFSHSGNSIASAVPESVRNGEGEIHVYELAPQFKDVGTGINASVGATIVTSDDLTRAAVYDHGVLAVHDLSSRRLIGSARIPGGTRLQMFFVSDDVVRIYANSVAYAATPRTETRALTIYEFNARTRQLVQTGSVSANANWMTMRVSSDGSTLLINERLGNDAKVLLADARTGAERAVIDGRVSFWIAPLSGGGAAWVQKSDTANAVVHIVDGHGAGVPEVMLPRNGAGMVREVVPGKTLAVALSGERPQEARGWSVYTIDMQSGSIVRTENNLSFRTPAFPDDPRWPKASPQYIVADAQNALWRWNALTGAKTRVF